MKQEFILYFPYFKQLILIKFMTQLQLMLTNISACIHWLGNFTVIFIFEYNQI